MAESAIALKGFGREAGRREPNAPTLRASGNSVSRMKSRRVDLRTRAFRDVALGVVRDKFPRYFVGEPCYVAFRTPGNTSPGGLVTWEREMRYPLRVVDRGAFCVHLGRPNEIQEEYEPKLSRRVAIVTAPGYFGKQPEILVLKGHEEVAKALADAIKQKGKFLFRPRIKVIPHLGRTRTR